MLLELIFPKKCVSCGKNGKYICLECISKQKTTKPICPFCFKPSLKGFTHRRCGEKITLSRLATIWEYNGVIKKAISYIKYKYAERISEEIVLYMIPFIKRIYGYKYSKKIILIPIPIHQRKRRYRDFNQTETIGKLIANRLSWIYLPDLIHRKKYSLPQVQLSRIQRTKNIIGNFTFNLKYSNMKNKYPIVLFDDVWTTGSTMKEAAKVIKTKLANPIWGLTIVR